MTAIAALNGRTEAYMLTDTLGSDDSHTVTDWRQKAFPIAHLGAVIACRSATDTQLAVFDRCQNYDSFDAMLLTLPQNLSDALNSRMGRVKEYGLDGAIMGWSDQQRRIRLASFASETGFALDFAPLVAAPSLSDEQLAQCGISATADTPIPPVSSLLRMMERQRQEFGGIGGAAVLTLLKRDVIQQSLVHRWPDKLGDKVAVRDE